MPDHTIAESPAAAPVVERVRRPLLLRRDVQRLSKYGSSACLTVIKPLLRHLGWVPGQSVIVELYDNDSILVRRPTSSDFGPQVSVSRNLPLPIVGQQ